MPIEIDERSSQSNNNASRQIALARAKAIELLLRKTDAEDPRSTPLCEPIPPERNQLAAAGIAHLSSLIRELNELWIGPESDEYGTLRPTKYAFDEATRLLVDAAIVAAGEHRQIPRGCVSTDADGGVRIEWVRNDASVHLVVPSTGEAAPYIYHEVGSDYGTEDARDVRLAFWLRRID
jgi:hypothetical protein